MSAVFYLTNRGVSNRYRLHLEDEDGTTVFIGQPREMKPMCIDELALLRGVAVKENFYERIHDERGYHYVLRARDAHELGHGPFCETEQQMLEQIEAVKSNAASAEFVDQTPEETRIRAIDFIRMQTDAYLENQGFESIR